MIRGKRTRRSITVVMTALMMSLSPFFVAEIQAADSSDGKQDSKSTKEEKKDSDDYNELGIKKGTEVYGEDISELSEDELKYIPKDWRDGKVESEHPKEEEDDKEQHARLKAKHPNVNNYIDSKNLPEASVSSEHKSVLPNFGYRNGVGKPEGVVAHETANGNSTINSEINYMTNNYNNAFVHAFADDKHVKEVHSTDYGAWGAGQHANKRFIHVELVRTHSFDAFARSINNYANYIAELLNEYNLGVSAAKPNGTGTLWSHNNVTNYLGGTDHTDPVAYFNSWGYSWSEFVNLVEKKYSKLTVDYKGISKMGKIKSNKAKIHTNMTGAFSDTKKAGKKYSKNVYYVKQRSKRNGKTYYLISKKPSRTKGTIGWVAKRDINVKKHKKRSSDKKTLVLDGSGAAFDKPWGGKKDKVEKNMKPYKGDFFDVKKTETVGKTDWYQGNLDGKQVWLKESHFKDKPLATFTDVPAGSSHHQNIYELTEKGIINGVPQANDERGFEPVNNISRSHVAVIFTNALDLPDPDNEEAVLQDYNDIDDSHQYAKEIAATNEAGVLTGSDGEFMDSSLTREQMATVMVNAYDLEDTDEDPGINLDNVSKAHQDSVKILAQHEITVTEDDFRPSEKVTRGQFATFVNKSMKAAKE